MMRAAEDCPSSSAQMHHTGSVATAEICTCLWMPCWGWQRRMQRHSCMGCAAPRFPSSRVKVRTAPALRACRNVMSRSCRAAKHMIAKSCACGQDAQAQHRKHTENAHLLSIRVPFSNPTFKLRKCRSLPGVRAQCTSGIMPCRTRGRAAAAWHRIASTHAAG